LRALDNIAARPLAVQEVLRRAPTVGDSLCDACREHFADARRYLDAFGVRYEIVPTLVRGLDYYTRTAWEFVGPEGGSQSTLSGGGRYDGLAEALGGPHTPGVGFGAGIERLLIALEHAGTAGPEPEGIDVFFVCADGADRAAVLTKLMELRAAGARADADFAGRSVKGQHTQAGRLGAKRVVVVDAATDLDEVSA
jgi:histidyl-tRNA synthetase